MAVEPSAALVENFVSSGGRDKVRVGQLHVCWAPTEEEAKRTALEQWPNGGLPGPVLGELAQPSDFAALADLADEERVAEAALCGPDPAPVLAALARFAGAGFQRVYLHQVGPDQEKFFRFLADELRPALGRGWTSRTSEVCGTSPRGSADT